MRKIFVVFLNLFSLNIYRTYIQVRDDIWALIFYSLTEHY